MQYADSYNAMCTVIRTREVSGAFGQEHPAAAVWKSATGAWYEFSRPLPRGPFRTHRPTFGYTAREASTGEF